MKIFILLALASTPFSVQAEEILHHVKSMLDQAIRVESEQNNKNNVKFLNKTLKMLNTSQFLWGVDNENKSCAKKKDGGITLAFVLKVDPKKSARLVYICPVANDNLNLEQMSHVLLHEMAHLQGVKNEVQANFVANRVFADCGQTNPFLFKEFKDAVEFQSKIELASKEAVASIFATPENLAYAKDKAKQMGLWSEADQAWLFEPYPDRVKAKSATSKHVFFELGSIVLSKKRTLNNN